MTRSERAAFLVALALGASVMWMSTYPPMTDLPQHAGQVVLLRELLFGRSEWGDLFRINWLTPYWIGYGLAVPLSEVMSVSAALKSMLSLAFVAWVYACIRLRRALGGDPRLDWLFLPSFFGFAWKWGFFTFLVAAPLGLAFIELARRHALLRTRATALALAAAGTLLFFAHGLVFLFAVGIGLAMTLALPPADERPWAPRRWGPYAFLLAGFAAFLVVSQSVEARIDFGQGYNRTFDMGWTPHRPLLLFAYSVGLGSERLLAVPAALLAVAPWLMGARIDLRRIVAIVPLVALVIVWLAGPSFALKTAFLYERFALFALPFYAMAFLPAPSSSPSASARIGGITMLVAAFAILAIVSARSIAFETESEPFRARLEVMEPGARALALVEDPDSPAARNPNAYVHFPVWYQVEKDGVVDFNFAWFPPQIVRYREDRLPPIRPGFEWQPHVFDWRTVAATGYRFFFLRGADSAVEARVREHACPVWRTTDGWAAYEASDACAPRANAVR